MKPTPLSPIWRVLDYLLTPIMYICAGTFRERPQETHIWHLHTLNPRYISSLSSNHTLTIEGTDPSQTYHRRVLSIIPSVLFHIPIFGGWREYVVLRSRSSTPWHIGWYIPPHNGDMAYFQVHKLQLHKNEPIRLLTGPVGRTVTFFAVDTDGALIPLTVIGTGTIGSHGSQSRVRLF